MSLYSLAQTESNFYVATNLDSSSTEKAVKSGVSVSSSQFGTVTQNVNSLTGNASYDFSSNGRVVHQWGGSGGISNFIHEIVFKKDNNPSQEVVLFNSLDDLQLILQTDGKVKAYVDPAFSGASTITTSADLCDGRFHHIVLSYMDGSTGYRLYVDGTLIQAKSTGGNLGNRGLVNLGSYLSLANVGSSYSEATIDFYAFYRDVQLSNAQVDTFVANHLAEFADRTVTVTPATGSGLAVQPALSISSTLTSTPATASALAGDTRVSNFDKPTMLDTYLAGQSLEQWYKFDEIGKIHNYGSGGNAETAWAFNGGTVIIPEGGIQGSGALKIKGEVGSTAQLAFGVNQPYSPEVSDNEFSIGLWFKAETGFGKTPPPYIVSLYNPFDSAAYHLKVNANGYAEWFMPNANNHNLITGTVNVTDGNWHFIQVRASDTNNLMKLSVDNGTEQSLSTTGTFPSVDGMRFGGNDAGSGTHNKYGYVSNFFITGYDSFTSTNRADAITAAAVPIQGSAGMVQPRVKFDSAFNDKTQSFTPILDFRLDDSTGIPANFGSITNFSAGINGTNVTYGNASINQKAYRFTNALTYLQGDWTAATGTFTTNAQQTVSVVFKANGYTSFEQILASTGMYGFIGTGITIAMAASTGHLSARLNRGFGGTDTESLTSTVNVGDNKWHNAVAVKNGSNFDLYLDGKKLTGITNSAITPADSGTWGVSAEGKYNFGQGSASKDTYIDEFAVFPGSFGADDVFELYQSIQNPTEWTASATTVTPTYSAGFGPIINANVVTAIASMGPVFPPINPATATGLFQQPNFAAIKNVSLTSDAMTASAQGENPGWDIGENNQVLHMNASAAMGDARVYIPGFWNASPAISNAQMVMPAISSTLGALVKPQSLNATAFLPLPPAYYTVSDDKWYQKLLDVDYQSPKYGGTLTFFNTSNNIYLAGSYGGWTAHSNRNPLNANYGYNLYDTPLPVAEAGYFDPMNRKALRLRNIALEQGDDETFVSGWTMETMIQTTKKNQFIAAGRLRGNPASSVSRSYRTGIRLKDGKIAFTNVKDSTLGFFKSTDSIAFTGFKDIADGEWHHIIIQYRPDGIDQYSARTQVWIDGKLDVQRYGPAIYYPGQIGYNSNDSDVFSDFNISAVSLNRESFVLERETYINYLAAFGITPIEAAPATASAELSTGTRGKGNRARALMLYFWPTFNAESGYYVGDYYNPFKPVGVNTSSGHDVGNESFDYDTFYGLSTYLTDKTQTFFDWDVFPLPVKNFYAGDTYRGDSNPLLNKDVTIKRGSVHGTTYVDPVTDNYRYLNLMKDVYELDQYDAIFFRNYPDQSKEQDAEGLNSKTEVDEYFNLQEKTLFAEFIDNLREAIDTYNISLFVTNPQLAKDLGIIANYAEVPLLRNQGSFFSDEYSDNRAPVVTGRVLVDGTPRDRVNEFGAGWIDTWFNDRHRVVNTLEYLTDDNTFIWTDYAYYQNSDEVEYGGPDRLYKRYENRPYGLQIDDEFVFADSGNPKFRLPYQAVKPSDVLAGIPITALSKKIWNQNYASYVQVDNPYKDYVTTIALPPGTNLKGKLTGGKIFVSFSENVSNTHTSANPQFKSEFAEYHEYDMASNYWVDIAFNAGIIDSATRAQYKAGTSGQPPLYNDNDSIKQYWSLSGDNIVSRVVPVTQNLKGFVGGDVAQLLTPPPTRTRTRNGLAGLLNSTRLRDALGRFASGGGSSSVTGGNLSTFKIQTGRVYDTGTVFTPSINTRALWWLSDKVRLTGKVVGGPAMNGAGQLPHPVVTADRPNTIVVQSMIATATLNETQLRGADRRISALPLYASATIIGLGGKNVPAGIGATATATINSAFAITQGPDQVIMYLHHVDPILYLRKEIIR